MAKERAVRVAVQLKVGSETMVKVGEDEDGEGGSDRPADQGMQARKATAENEQEDRGWEPREHIDPQESP